jgi:hypothetical protein
MARTQRSDHENFPSILIFLLVLTSVGTITFVFFGNHSGLKQSPLSVTRNHDGAANHNSQIGVESENLIRNIVGKSVLDAEVVYIIPGGGSGSGLHTLDYPEWSRQRVVAAHRHSMEKEAENKQSIFLALSAGSLNAPNLLLSDSRIVFECEFMIAHLIELGVPSARIFGDSMSWDTVTNALVARQFLEGLLTVKSKPKKLSKRKKSLRDEHNNPQGLVISTSPLQVEVFISDFHAERMKAAFNWVLNLEPSLFADRAITVAVHSVSSEEILWPDKEAFAERVKHEEEGARQIQENSQIVTTMAEFHAFLLLGPHKGLDSYLKNSYIIVWGGMGMN